MTTLSPALWLATPTADELRQCLRAGTSRVEPRGQHRLALLNPTPERIERALKLIDKGKPSRGVQDMWYVPDGLLLDGGKLAFMYPGIDSQMPIPAHDVADFFGIPRVRAQRDASLENRGNEVFFTSDLYTRVLRRIGIHPDITLGHSIGEWCAMVASGFTPEQNIDEIAVKFQPGMLPVPGVVFVALSCGVEQARATIADLPSLEISHDNCPHQSIICGLESSADIAIQRFLADKVICQKLDFRSGFHTSLFKDYTAVIEKSFRSLAFSQPHVPMWSATTCEPYPRDQEALHQLMIRHLVEPVRFRELTERLYAEGVRVFLQVGAGSLPGFVNDTLRGRPHQALSTLVTQRSAFAQMERFLLALFAEGLAVSFESLQKPVEKVAPPPPAAAPVEHELVQEMESVFAAMRSAMQEVTAALNTTAPFKKRIAHQLSLKERPELMDHCLYRQKKGWKNTSDLFPVMPMTATIELVRRLAEDAVPDRVVIAIEDIAASKWLAVESIKDLEVELSFDGRKRLRVEIIGHFVATAVLATAYPAAPLVALEPLQNPRPSEIALRTVYEDGWLFHGPLYQCLASFDGIGSNGIDGKIRATSTPGALLDNVGQLAGLWIMQSQTEDRYAMPIRIKRIAFFGPQPEIGTVECQVRNRRIRSRDIMFDMEVSAQGRVWARLEAWEKWRFECEETLWQFLLKPGRRFLADQRRGFSWFEPTQFSDTIAHDLSRRYLREAERKIFQSLGPKRNAWICGRVAAKDAIRHYLWARGYPQDIFPGEIWIENDAQGKPVVTELPGSTPLHISISHKDGLGVAMVSEHPIVGIDLERIEARQESFATTVFTDREIRLLPRDDDDRSEWITRFWSAKEAFAKSTGLGLQGDPRQFVIEELQTDRIRIQKAWVQSIRCGSFIVSHYGGTPS